VLEVAAQSNFAFARRNFAFEADSITSWKAYKIGQGVSISYDGRFFTATTTSRNF
jgi:hypothetical protein